MNHQTSKTLLADDTKQRKANARQVEKIRIAVSNYRQGRPTPAVVKALGAGLIVGVCVVVACKMLNLQPLVGALAACFSFIVVYQYIFKHSANQTQAEHLYNLLADYNPIDKEGYKKLQEKAQADQLLFDDLLSWVWEELAAQNLELKNSPEQLRLDRARRRFVEKGPDQL